MEDDALEVVRLRNFFYRDNYRRVVSALLACLLIILLLVGTLVYMVTHRPAPRYFASTADGRIVPLVALSRPNQSDKTVLQWANEATIAAYSFNYVNYRKALQQASGYFTKAGWKQFLTALEQSNNLDAIRKKKLVMRAVATGAPVIVQEGKIRGVYSWKIQMPLLVSLESPNQVIQQPLTVTILINRVSALDNPKGLAISQFVASPRSGDGSGNG